MTESIKLPVGIESFDEIRSDGYYYVDKTKLIEQLVDSRGKVNLFTRPRRFGKTLNMSMLKSFFEIGAASELFDGLYISHNKKMCDDNMGKYPVIFLSLKNVEGLDFQAAKYQMIEIIAKEAKRFAYLKQSDRLDIDDKSAYASLIRFCNNFEYFRVNKNGAENGITESLNEKIYNTKAQIVRELQAPVYSSDEVYADYRKSLVDDLKEDVISLNDDSFMVKRHLRYVEFFRASSSWDNLETIEISDIREHIAPLIRPKKEDELARRFDYLVYSIDLGLLQSKSIQSPVNIVVQTAEKLSAKYSIPQVEKKKEIIEKVQTNEFWDKVTIIELDTVREALRGLLQYLDRQVRPIYYTNFTDSITDGTPGEPLYGGNDLKNYRKKVEFYLKEHSDKLSVYKLKNNKKLTETDLRELERILWTELGSKEDYIKEYGETPIGRLVRKIVGVDRAAVNEAFSCFMSEERLNINQMRFVNLIVDYIVANGNIEDNKVLMGEPFKSVGSITTLFKDDMSTAKQIMEIVNQIKRNSEEIA